MGARTPHQNRGIALVYPGKPSAPDPVAEVGPVRFRPASVIGQARLDGWVNRLILGDSLPVLRALLDDHTVAQRIRLVYIDPPFSTDHEYRGGSLRTATVSASRRDPKAYDDRLAGPEYLEFLRQRLVLLGRLLADDGSIYVHIDYKVGHYVRVLLDEIFGQDHFINDIARVKCNPKNFPRKAYGNIKDMILFYSKGKDRVWNGAREEMAQEDIARLFPKMDGEGRRYTTTPLHAPGETQNGPTGRPWRGLKPPRGRHWRYDPEELSRLDREGLIEWSTTGNPRKKIYADEVVGAAKKRQDIWHFKDPAYPSYPTEKNLDMLKAIVEASSEPDDIVLDCFTGSGTTLVAAELCGRRWIGVDSSPVAIRVARSRLVAIRHISAFRVLRAS